MLDNIDDCSISMIINESEQESTEIMTAARPKTMSYVKEKKRRISNGLEKSRPILILDSRSENR